MLLIILAALGTVATFFTPTAAAWVQGQLLLQFPTINLPLQAVASGLIFLIFVLVLLVYGILVRTSFRPR